MKVVVTVSAGRGRRKHEWYVNPEDYDDFTMALGLFLQDNYGWGK